MKCIEMRQKLIMSSDKADIKYDRALIQKLFLRTLERVKWLYKKLSIY